MATSRAWVVALLALCGGLWLSSEVCGFQKIHRGRKPAPPAEPGPPAELAPPGVRPEKPSEKSGDLEKLEMFYRQAFQTLAGNQNTWYVISLQEAVQNGNIISKGRSHLVVQGRESAARQIAVFMAGGIPRTRKFFWESFATQGEAEEKAAWWRQYNQQAGYQPAVR